MRDGALVTVAAFWDLSDGSVHLSIDGIVANTAQVAFRHPQRESRW
jgi:hypothetical protein